MRKSGENKEVVSLINKCYIKGYENEIFDASDLSLFSITKDGVLMPANGSSYDKEVLYFPAFVEIDSEVVEIKTIKGFKGLKNNLSKNAISEVYVPDTVTSLPFGGTHGDGGVFGDQASLKVIVVGSGITVIEQELFSEGDAVSLEKFIFKGLITSIGSYAFQNCKNATDFDWENNYEFNTRLTSIDYRAFSSANVITEIYIEEGFTPLAYGNDHGYYFNNANNLRVCVYKTDGTRENPHTIFTETWSYSPKYGSYSQQAPVFVITGYCKAGGQAILPDLTHYIYMDSVDAAKYLIASICAQNHEGRLANTVIMICSEEQAYDITSYAKNCSEDDIVLTPIDGYKHFNTELKANGCTVTEEYLCCGEVSSTTEAHRYNGGSSCLRRIRTDDIHLS